MTTLTAKADPAQAAARTVPPLENGDRLTAGKFLRRYDAMAHIEKAQLIEGIVYMPSPVSHNYHRHPHATATIWLGHYLRKTSGLIISDYPTTELDEYNVPQSTFCSRYPPV